MSWRAFALILTSLVGWGITGSMSTGLAIGGADCLIKLGTYYTHERLWLRVKWGRINSAPVSRNGRL